MLEKTLNKIIKDTEAKQKYAKVTEGTFKLFKTATEEEKKEAYNKAKSDTLRRFPKMYKFFDFIEQRLGECREETDSKSEQEGVKKIDD